MDLLEGEAAFAAAVALLPVQLKNALLALDAKKRATAQEIRLLLYQRPQVRCDNRTFWLEGAGEITQAALNECFVALCDNAVHTHQREIAAGYISLGCGHRAAVAGRAVYDGEKLIGVREINAVVIRVARLYRGCAKPVLQRAFDNGVCSLLLVGAPASGKTTVLRDLACALGTGAVPGVDRVAVADERGELAGCCEGCSVLSGFDKADALMLAVRNLSPQVVLCDEIFSDREIDAVIKAQNCGAAVITTIHAKDRRELLQKEFARRLLREGGFKKAAFLSEFPHPAFLTEVFDVDDIAENDRRGAAYNGRGGMWDMAVAAAKAKGFAAL